ncbi:MAG TPA: hypothetical protein VK615_02900 [Candidatus Binatia bacterium]|nr:hypothetical protein [Candidatus Binatia bacterium]
MVLLRNADSIQPATGVLPWWGERWHKPFFVLFLVVWGVGLAFPYLGPERAIYWTGMLLMVALLSTLATLGRQLPFQNVVFIALIVGFAAAVWTMALERWFDWRVALLWTVIILNSRGAAQFLMRRYRNTRFYGWAIFGIGAVIPAAFAGILYNQWPQIVSAPLMTLVILLITFPLFMNKRPIEPPVSPQPLFLTIALLAWLVIHSTV